MLDDDLTFSTPTTGRQRVQKPNLSWATTDVVMQDIYQGVDTLDGLGIGDEVWVIPQGGRWLAFAVAGGVDEDPSSKGCCGECIGQVFMTLDDLYAKKYIVKNIPAQLGGPHVLMTYVGQLATSPISLISATDVYYWESDEFEYTTDAGTDYYTWRMIVGADGTASCKASFGQNNTVLYLINTGSATVGTDLSSPRCDPGSLADQFVQYANLQDWRARCGSTLYLRFPQFQQREVEALLPCTVCINPDPTIDYSDLDACWQSLCDTMGRTDIPGSIYIRLDDLVSELDGGGQRYVKSPTTKRLKLDFDLADMTYKSVQAITAPDCAGSSPQPNTFKLAAKINDPSTLGSASPTFPDPLVYFAISCVDATHIRVESFARSEWEISNDGATHDCSKTVDLTISNRLEGVFTNYLHAVRVSPAIDLTAGEFAWSLSE